MRICVATLTSVLLLVLPMQDDDEEIEVVVPVEENEIDSLALGKTLWTEITAGVGIWGAFRPVFSVILALIPFLYLGQHLIESTREVLIGSCCKSRLHLHWCYGFCFTCGQSLMLGEMQALALLIPMTKVDPSILILR